MGANKEPTETNDGKPEGDCEGEDAQADSDDDNDDKPDAELPLAVVMIAAATACVEGRKSVQTCSEMSWEPTNNKIISTTLLDTAMFLYIDSCKIPSSAVAETKIYSVAWTYVSLKGSREGGGSSHWRHPGAGKVVWKEYFTIPLLILGTAQQPKSNHKQGRSVLELVISSRVRSATVNTAITKVATIKVELSYQDDKRKRATLPFVDPTGERCSLEIEVQYKNNPHRPPGNKPLFEPPAKGMPGASSIGIANDTTDKLPLDPMHVTGKADRLRGGRSEKLFGPDLKSHDTGKHQFQIKKCHRCEEEYPVDFNGDDACIKGSHLEEVELDKMLIVRNVALGLLGGAIIGSTVGAAVGIFAKTGAAAAAKTKGSATLASALSGSNRAMDAGLGLHYYPPHVPWHLAGGSLSDWEFNPMHPNILGCEIGLLMGSAGGGALCKTKTFSPYYYTCCKLSSDTVVCNKKTSHVPSPEDDNKTTNPDEEDNNKKTDEGTSAENEKAQEP